MPSRLLHLWGKARPSGDRGVPYHPLLWHVLDVAAVGQELLRQRPDWQTAIKIVLGEDLEALPARFGFFCALHDIGKTSCLFQAKVRELWPASLFGDLRPAANVNGAHHTELGLELLLDHIPDVLNSVIPNTRRTVRKQLLMPFLAHHGRPREPADVARAEAWGKEGLQAARNFVALLHDLFAPPPLPANVDKAALARASWPLAGLVTLADWIGSNEFWFPFHMQELAPRDYFERFAKPRAEKAVLEAGLLPAPRAARLGLATLFDERVVPSPLQRWADRVELAPGPNLVLVEEVTGGGKTEAALVLAQRMIAAGRARGVYIGLPTMATANAMFARIGKLGRRLFSETATPSLGLAHSRSGLVEGFRLLGLGQAGPGAGSLVNDERNEGQIEATDWLADDRRKVFLCDLGVGTIDQALLAVLPASFQALRLLGLHERVLIVDEAHAYDGYTTELLARLLHFQAALGGSVIVLSATLPIAVRRKLVDAFARGLGVKSCEPRERSYPLVTRLAGTRLEEIPQSHRPDLGRSLRIERVGQTEEAIARIQEAAARGAAVCWIRNTVDDALAAFDRIRADRPDVHLFHARFAMADRLEREQLVLDRFGRSASETQRRGVLVATQVVEQSLDLDFDLMVTDLAPIDLLLQRAGRLWRHDRGRRSLAEPRLIVLAPEAVEEPGRDWLLSLLPGTASVYRDHARLWLTARALFARETVRIPDDVRDLVEAVYGEAAERDVPAALERNFFRSDGERKAAEALAGQNALDPCKGYLPESGAWSSDVRTPTRLGEPMVTLRLARVEQGEVRPWCGDPDPRRAWALSEVQVRAARLAAIDPPRGCAPELLEKARRSWGRFEAERSDLLLVPLVRSERTGLWEGSGRGRADRRLELLYGCARGLELREA